MKKLLAGLLAGILMFGASATVFAASYTHGYTRSNGTHVRGYYHTAPNNTRLDNYSTRGNYNPYTGKVGTKNPYKY